MKNNIKIVIAIFISILVALIFFRVFNKKTILSKVVNKIYTIENINGIVNICITGKHKITTRASVYSKYNISQISDEFIFFNSSDVGKYILTNTISGKWNIYHAKNDEINNINVYFIYETKAEKDLKFRKLNTIHVLFENKGKKKIFKLNGYFYPYELCYNVKKNELIINTGYSHVVYDINSDVEKIKRKEESFSIGGRLPENITDGKIQ